MIVLVDLEQQEDPIRLDKGPGDERRPGGSERQSHYMAAGQEDTITPTMISERIRIRPLTGKCG